MQSCSTSWRHIWTQLAELSCMSALSDQAYVSINRSYGPRTTTGKTVLLGLSPPASSPDQSMSQHKYTWISMVLYIPPCISVCLYIKPWVFSLGPWLHKDPESHLIFTRPMGCSINTVVIRLLTECLTLYQILETPMLQKSDD